jgi:glutamate 5-kinase
MAPPSTRTLPPIRRIVVKIGSAVLAPGGSLDQAAADRLGADIAAARAQGVQVAVVSSGAVASGYSALGLKAPPKTIVRKQAAAAVGQSRLMAAWNAALLPHGLVAAQILYTAEDLEHRERFLSARRTLNELLGAGVVPVINENDTVSYEEIKLGDNDRLSALTADLADADLLLILSSVSGLYESGKSGKVIHTIQSARTAQAHVRPDKTVVGTGGMQTKLTAAAAAASWGIPTVVAGGHEHHVIRRVLAGEVLGTLFPAARITKARARKRWLGFGARARGTIIIDAGAARALTQRGASLLPSGVTGVRGSFDRGAAVQIAVEGGAVIARGVSAYSSDDVARIAGKRSSQIEGVLGHYYAEEVVHRDDLVVGE